MVSRWERAGICRSSSVPWVSRPLPAMENLISDITEYEAGQIDQTNASGLSPVVFIHGLWLLPSSWDRWRTVFQEAGFATIAPGWPDDPNTVADAREHPEVSPRSSLPLRCSATRPTTAARSRSPTSSSGSPSPTSVSAQEAKELYDTFAVPGSGVPLFQAATANLDPWTEVKVKTKNPERGPLLIIDGEKDNTVPWAIATASYKKQKRNVGVTQIVKVPGRGHSLTIDHGWREVADLALGFVQKFVKP